MLFGQRRKACNKELGTSESVHPGKKSPGDGSAGNRCGTHRMGGECQLMQLPLSGLPHAESYINMSRASGCSLPVSSCSGGGHRERWAVPTRSCQHTGTDVPVGSLHYSGHCFCFSLLILCKQKNPQTLKSDVESLIVSWVRERSERRQARQTQGK